MNAHTKQQQDKVFEIDFIDSQNRHPYNALLLALIYIFIYIQAHVAVNQGHVVISHTPVQGGY